MTDNGYIKVAKLSDLHDKAGTLVTVRDEDIVLFKNGGKVYAISNVCAHQHFSALHQGEVNDAIVTCPMHGWSYDIKTGKSANGHGKIPCFTVLLKDDDVYIEAPQPRAAW